MGGSPLRSFWIVDWTNMDEDPTLFWLALTRVDGLGVRTAHKLIKRFGSPQGVYMASLTELEGAGLAAPVAQALFAQAGLKEAEKEMKAAVARACRLLTFTEEDYPTLLRKIADPPLVLYVRVAAHALTQLYV